MKIALISCILILFSCQVNAQSKAIRGVIFEKGSALRVAQARVSNESRSLSFRSDGLGIFTIQAALGDTLKISKEGYTDHSVVISGYQDLVIQLAKPIQLSEVRVTGQSKKQELDEYKREYRRKGSYYAGKPPLLSYIFKPLTALYELVGKTPGQARRFNKFYSWELEQTEVDRRFNAYSVQPLTGYQGKDLQSFLETYRPSFGQLSGWAEYDFVKYISKSVAAFEAAGRPQARTLPKLPKAPDLSEKVMIKY